MTPYTFVLVLAGAGKSTLMTALLRIVEIDEGQILIDGQDIRDVGLAKLRSNIACIPQDPTLYSGKSISLVLFCTCIRFFDSIHLGCCSQRYGEIQSRSI
jgi:ABC-type transport system involved in Fe-S cluster assembly fused permease/ATPase subunit